MYLKGRKMDRAVLGGKHKQHRDGWGSSVILQPSEQTRLYSLVGFLRQIRGVPCRVLRSKARVEQ